MRQRTGVSISSGAILTRRAALRFLAVGTGAAMLAACTSTPPAPASGPAPPPKPTDAPPSTSSGQAKPTALAAATSVAAPAPKPPEAAKPAEVAKPAVQPKAGGILRLGLPADLSKLEGHLLSRDAYDSIWNVWDRLTEYDDKLQPRPMLAESWELSSDQRQIKLSLRKGVTWHTGREFTSEDVRWNFLRVRDPKVGVGQLKTLSDWFQEIETPDKNTIILKSDAPRPSVFDYFEFFNMVDRETAEGPNPDSKAVGTGPFAFDEWKTGVHLRLLKNKNYWQSGKPYLDGITFSVKLDPASMVIRFESDDLDAMKTAPAADFVRLKSDPRYQNIVHPATGAFYVMGINTSLPPLDNKKVRQALNWAIDRKRFTDTVLLGTTQPLSLPNWNPSSPAYDEQKRSFYSFNLEQATALLKEAGAANFEIDIILQPSPPELIEFSQVYQSDLAKLGVKLNIVKLDLAAWLDQANNAKYNGMYAATTSYAQLRSPSMMYTSGPVWNPVRNNQAFKSDRYAELVNASGSEIDPAKQKQIYSQLNDIILDESFVIPLAPNPPRVSLHARVKGVGHLAHEGFSYTDCWIDA